MLIKLSPKLCIKSYKQKEWPWKTVRLTDKLSKSTFAIHFNHLQVFLSVSLFVFPVFLTPSFHVLSRYFCLSISLVAVTTVWILINFVAQLLLLFVISPRVRESGFQNPTKFCRWSPESGKICLWNPESWNMETGIAAQGIRNRFKDWNPESKFDW